MKGRFKMFQIRQMLYVVAFAILSQSWAFAAQPLDTVRAVRSDGPDDKLIEAFTGNAKTFYYSFTHLAIKDKALVSDRILDGFEADPWRLNLKDGTAIYWGFRYKEATVQSVAIFDARGRPRLLAAVNDIPWCGGRHCDPFTSVEAYQADASGSYLHPSISVFVRDERDLKTYLPYLKRWLHAKLLGFNVDCKKPGMTEACRFVTQTEWLQIVPTRIYLLPPMRLLEPPKVKAADIPLEAFRR